MQTDFNIRSWIKCCKSSYNRMHYQLLLLRSLSLSLSHPVCAQCPLPKPLTFLWFIFVDIHKVIIYFGIVSHPTGTVAKHRTVLPKTVSFRMNNKHLFQFSLYLPGYTVIFYSFVFILRYLREVLIFIFFSYSLFPSLFIVEPFFRLLLLYTLDGWLAGSVSSAGSLCFRRPFYSMRVFVLRLCV